MWSGSCLGYFTVLGSAETNMEHIFRVALTSDARSPKQAQYPSFSLLMKYEGTILMSFQIHNRKIFELFSIQSCIFFCFLDDVHCLKLSASFAASIFMPDLHCLFHLPSASHRFFGVVAVKHACDFTEFKRKKASSSSELKQ